MATLQELDRAIEKVKGKTIERVGIDANDKEENNDMRIKKFVKEQVEQFAIKELTIMGIDTSEIKSDDALQRATANLPKDKHRTFSKDCDAYAKEVIESVIEMKKGSFARLKELPKNVMDIVTKGAGAGMTVSAIINHYFPQAFTVIATALTASSQEMNAFQKGLAYIGLASRVAAEVQPELVLGVGAVAGATIYTAGKLVKSACKKIKNRKNKKEENDIER